MVDVIYKLLRSSLLVLGLMAVTLDGKNIGPNFCEGESFDADCGPTSIILMTRARYGRMKLGKCLKTDYGQLGCQVDVTRYLDAVCSGRQACSVRVSSIVDMVPDQEQRCSSDLRSYLQADYQCIPVETKPGNVCPPQGTAVVNSTAGFIASTVFTKGSQLGSIECPWQIRALPGQRVNITLYDFATGQFSQDISRGGPEICHVYVSIKEVKLGTGDTVCAGAIRQRLVYQSMSDTVEIRIVSSKGRNMFLLKYEAIDCPNPKAPFAGSVERINPELAILRCNHSDSLQRYHCRNQRWEADKPDIRCPGTDITASNRISLDASVQDRLWNFISGTHEVSIIIIVCVAMIIGCSILAMGLVCIRRKRILHDRHRLVRTGGPRSGPSIVSVYQPAPQKDGDYHEHRAMLPAPPMSSIESNGYPQNQNDYYRTWQLRHAGPQHRDGYGPLPPVPIVENGSTVRGAYPANGNISGTSMPQSAVDDNYADDPVEHIYESPKFERREMQYYELDPTSVPVDTTSSRMVSPQDYH